MRYSWWLLVVYFGFCLKCDAQDSCRTPDGVEAKCIDLRHCQPMLDLLRTLRRPQPPEVTEKLNAYKCGTNYKVCCPSTPIYLAPTVEYHNRKVAPDVSNHKNFHLLPTECGYLDDTFTKIVNGEDANMNEFKWMAVLQYQTSRGLAFMCGGTMINYNYILTAAHCLGLKDAKLVSVRVGEHSLKNETDCAILSDVRKTIKCNPPVQDLKVEEIISHPQFVVRTKNILNDIALIRVSKIKKAENVLPVCLPVGEIRDKPFSNVFVTGWGLTNSQTNERADILQKVSLPIKDKTACAATYSESGIELTSTQICAGGVNGKASCSGDSGGPMLVPAYVNDSFIYVQRGIVSIGPSYCGIKGYPGVYTVVKYYMDWILDNMKP